MSSTERLLEVLEGVFAGSPIEMNPETIEAMVEDDGPAHDQRVLGSDERRRGVRGHHEGPDALRDAWTDWLEAFSRVSFRDRGGREPSARTSDAYARQVGVTRHDGVEIEQPSAAVFKFAGDRLHRVEFHLDRAAAERSARQ